MAVQTQSARSGPGTRQAPDCEKTALAALKRAGIGASSRTKTLGWHDRDPQSAWCRRAASGRARLGYAGGSRRSSEPFELGDPELARILDRQSFTLNLGKSRNCYGRNNNNDQRHIPTRLLNVLRKRPRVVIYRVSVDNAVGMFVSNNVAVSPARVMESKAEVVMAGVSCRGFRCGNADALERKREGRQHHHDDGKLPKRMPCAVHRPIPGKWRLTLQEGWSENKALLALLGRPYPSSPETRVTTPGRRFATPSWCYLFG
jgi:hypothetical protein